jgi:hypothetical protein
MLIPREVANWAILIPREVAAAMHCSMIAARNWNYTQILLTR